MALPNHDIDSRLLECARANFLNCGFEKASLKKICENAGVTTGALYKRYSGKEELFVAVVADTVADLEQFALMRSSVTPESLSDEELISIWNMNDDAKTLLRWFEFLEQRRTGFVLLISCSAGTRYKNFQHDWVEKMSNASYNFYLELQKRGIAKAIISVSEMHILMTAFWSTVYEPFVHEYDWKQIEEHCTIACRLFDWKRVFQMTS